MRAEGTELFKEGHHPESAISNQAGGPNAHREKPEGREQETRRKKRRSWKKGGRDVGRRREGRQERPLSQLIRVGIKAEPGL